MKESKKKITGRMRKKTERKGIIIRKRVKRKKNKRKGRKKKE